MFALAPSRLTVINSQNGSLGIKIMLSEEVSWGNPGWRWVRKLMQ